MYGFFKQALKEQLLKSHRKEGCTIVQDMAALAVAFDGVGSGAGFLFCGVSVCGFLENTE